MYKLLILVMLLGSCALPKPNVAPNPVHRFKSKQELILECYKLLRRLGEDGKQAGELCLKLYKGDKSE